MGAKSSPFRPGSVETLENASSDLSPNGTYTGDPPPGLTAGGPSSGTSRSDQEVCGDVVPVVSVRVAGQRRSVVARGPRPGRRVPGICSWAGPAEHGAGLCA